MKFFILYRVNNQIITLFPPSASRKNLVASGFPFIRRKKAVIEYFFHRMLLQVNLLSPLRPIRRLSILIPAMLVTLAVLTIRHVFATFACLGYAGALH